MKWLIAAWGISALTIGGYAARLLRERARLRERIGRLSDGPIA